MAVVGSVVGPPARARRAPPPLDLDVPSRFVVVVTGHPGSGKTSLAVALAADLGVPLVTKDQIKERLFDTLGIGDREWSHRLGAASMAVLYDLVRSLLPVTSVVAEANFHPRDASRPLREAAEAAGAAVVQVVLDVPADVLLARAEERATTGERHPGHLDEHLLDELAEQVREPAAPVELPGDVLRVGPDDDPADIARRIRQAVHA